MKIKINRAEALALLGWFSIFEAKGRCQKTKTTYFLFVLRSVLQTDTFLRVITIKNKKRMYHKSTINMISNEIPSFSLFFCEILSWISGKQGGGTCSHQRAASVAGEELNSCDAWRAGHGSTDPPQPLHSALSSSKQRSFSEFLLLSGFT